MSASQTTATRRELRRAFGPRAIETLNAQADQVQQLALLCQALTQEVDALRREVARLQPVTRAVGRLQTVVTGDSTQLAPHATVTPSQPNGPTAAPSGTPFWMGNTIT